MLGTVQSLAAENLVVMTEAAEAAEAAEAVDDKAEDDGNQHVIVDAGVGDEGVGVGEGAFGGTVGLELREDMMIDDVIGGGGRTRRKLAAAVTWGKGERLLGKYKDGYWYPCVLEDTRDDGRFVISWEDGDKNDQVKSALQLRPRAAEEEGEGMEEKAEEAGAAAARARKRARGTGGGTCQGRLASAEEIYNEGDKRRGGDADARRATQKNAETAAGEKGEAVGGVGSEKRGGGEGGEGAAGAKQTKAVEAAKRKEEGGKGKKDGRAAANPMKAEKRERGGEPRARGTARKAKEEAATEAEKERGQGRGRRELHVLTGGVEEGPLRQKNTVTIGTHAGATNDVPKAALPPGPTGRDRAIPQRLQVGEYLPANTSYYEARRSGPPVPARREEGEYVGTVRFKRGELVEAWHKTGGWHKATIHELLGDGSVKVTWADDDPTDRIKKRKKIRPVRVD